MVAGYRASPAAPLINIHLHARETPIPDHGDRLCTTLRDALRTARGSSRGHKRLSLPEAAAESPSHSLPGPKGAMSWPRQRVG